MELDDGDDDGDGDDDDGDDNDGDDDGDDDNDGDDDDDDMVIELGRFGMRSRRREESLECGIQAKGSFDLARRAPQSTLPGCMNLSL